jgi:vacuolar-type H+-ATPase subunit I/STV1
MKKLLEKIANDNTLISVNDKLKQTQGRAIKAELNRAMTELLSKELASDLVNVLSVSNGVGVSIDNEKVGMISFEVVMIIKDLEYDLEQEHEDFENELRAKAQAKAEAEKAKAEKIARDKKKRGKEFLL